MMQPTTAGRQRSAGGLYWLPFLRSARRALFFAFRRRSTKALICSSRPASRKIPAHRLHCCIGIPLPGGKGLSKSARPQFGHCNRVRVARRRFSGLALSLKRARQYSLSAPCSSHIPPHCGQSSALMWSVRGRSAISTSHLGHRIFLVPVSCPRTFCPHVRTSINPSTVDLGLRSTLDHHRDRATLPHGQSIFSPILRRNCLIRPSLP